MGPTWTRALPAGAPRRRASRWLVGLLVAVVPVLGLAGCTHQRPARFETRPIRIQSGDVSGPVAAADVLHLTLAVCGAGATTANVVDVTEDARTVRVTVTGPVWTGDDQAACAGIATVTLSSPLGARTVVDTSDGHVVPLNRTNS